VKTLRELWEENFRRPFDALIMMRGGEVKTFHMVALTPKGVALGWKESGDLDYCDGMANAMLDKPRLQAWRSKESGVIKLHLSSQSYKDSELEYYERIPWLDQPRICGGSNESA